jgi:hypothetical protein
MCGKAGRVGARLDNSDPICHACYQRTRENEICALCGKPGKVNRRLADGGAMCPRCYDKRSIRRVHADNARQAKRRGLEWSLDLDRFKTIVSRRCRYCGRNADDLGLPFLGVDRMDNTQGYVPDNCVPCCWPCNCAKGKLASDAFIALCRMVAANNP